MASRATKVTVRVIGGVLAAILVAVLAVVAWALFRPLLQGDYNHTYGYIRTVSTLSETPLSAMVASVGSPISGENDEQLENRIANTLGQIEVIREDVTEAQDSRAGTKDSDVKAEVASLGDAYDTLTATFESWQNDGYAAIGSAAKACMSSQADCQQVAATVEGLDPQGDALEQLRQAVITTADSGSSAELETALIGVADTTDNLWASVEDSLTSVSDVLNQKGAEVDE